MERSVGLWGTLRLAPVYEAAQSAIGAERMLRILVRDHIRPSAGMSVLDLGCGTGTVAALMPEVAYTGIDNNRRYILAAQHDRPHGRFLCGDFSTARDLPAASFDLVLGIGLLHHLSAADMVDVFAIAAERLKPEGRLVTIDPCYCAGQNPLARALIALDRGRSVLEREGYECAAATAFGTVRSFVRHDTLAFPYTHCIVEAASPRHPADG